MEEEVLDVNVELLWVASFSAEVLFGGVISGVLLGTATATLPALPHAPSASEHTSAISRPAAARAT